mmetsp:Transcript_23680/g.48014  ORF Transcript_23680/g.48014 Transcript_23680/m.48014 type:complete len:155 (-) Transcript_23680:286-750(-)
MSWAPQQQPRPQQGRGVGSTENNGQIASLVQFARSNYEENPTDALSALMEAMKLNSGQADADRAMERVRRELGHDVTVMEPEERMKRAARVVREMLADESTLLFAQGRQDILRQAMEDGSSVFCTRCGGVVPSARWQQHQQFWCEAVEVSGGGA